MSLIGQYFMLLREGELKTNTTLFVRNVVLVLTILQAFNYTRYIRLRLIYYK